MTGVKLAGHYHTLSTSTAIGNINNELNNDITMYSLMGIERLDRGTSYLSEDKEIFIIHKEGIKDSSGVIQFSTVTYDPEIHGE